MIPKALAAAVLLAAMTAPRLAWAQSPPPTPRGSYTCQVVTRNAEGHQQLHESRLDISVTPGGFRYIHNYPRKDARHVLNLPPRGEVILLRDLGTRVKIFGDPGPSAPRETRRARAITIGFGDRLLKGVWEYRGDSKYLSFPRGANDGQDVHCDTADRY